MDNNRLRGSLLCHADGVVDDSPPDALVSSEGAGAALDNRANSSVLVAAKLGDLGDKLWSLLCRLFQLFLNVQPVMEKKLQCD